MTRRALIYGRVSYNDRRNESLNLKGQIEDGREYAKSKGYRIIAELSEDDRGASGASFELPKLSQALEMAERGEFDIFICRELDRLSRGLAKQLIVEEEFKRYGVEIEFVLGDYPDTAEGNLMKNVRGVISEYERLKIEERMTRARRRHVRNGRIILHGNAACYGYRVQEEKDERGHVKKRWLEICGPEAKVVKFVFTWYVTGDETGKPLSIKAIARKLTETKVLTWADTYGKAPFKKKGKRGEWSNGTVSTMLNNETYAGRWFYGKHKNSAELNPRSHWIEVEVPRIISDELFQKAQERRAYNKVMSKRNNGKHHYLLSRRVTCQCGTKMTGRTIPLRSGNGILQYYHCPKAKGANRTCDMKYFRADHVDETVWDWLKGLYYHPEHFCQELRKNLNYLKKEHRPRLNRLAVIDDLLANYEKQLGKLLDEYLEKDFSREMLTERKARLETNVNALREERGDIESALNSQLFLTDEEIEEEIKAYQGYWREFIIDMEEEEDEERLFNIKRGAVDDLDLKVTLAIENGWKVIHVRCTIAKETLSIDEAVRVYCEMTREPMSIESSSPRTCNFKAQPLILAARIVLEKPTKRKPANYTELLPVNSDFHTIKSYAT